MSTLYRAARLACVFPLLGLAAASGCEQEQGFECGRLIPGTSEVRRCDRALEVCVCATNSCAKKVGLTLDERRQLGLGGTAGSAGTSGSGGTAGSAGSVGSGGTAGSSGSAGSTGSGGGEGGMSGGTPGTAAPDAPAAPANDEADAWGDCPDSGYRYAEGPFANSDVAGKCVPKLDVVLGGFAKKADDWACPGQVDVPVGGSGGTSGGGSSGGGNAGSTSGNAPVGGTSMGGSDAGTAGQLNGGDGGTANGGVGAVSGGSGDAGAAAASFGGIGGGP